MSLDPLSIKQVAKQQTAELKAHKRDLRKLEFYQKQNEVMLDATKYNLAASIVNQYESLYML